MASFVVQSAAKQLESLLVEEAKYLYAVKEKVETMENELIWMGCFLQDADNRQHQEKVVQKWVADIRDFAYEAEDIIERYIHEVSHHRKDGIRNTLKWLSCLICDARALDEVGSSIDDLRAKITLLATRLQAYGIKVIGHSDNSIYSAMIREQRRTYAHTRENIVGLEEKVKQVVELLLDKEHHVLGIWGMGGLGKTTLTRKVYSNTAIKRHFSRSAWVYVSQNVESKVAFKEILTGLGYEDATRKIEDLGVQDLSNEIGKVLEGENCLVILDDIWTGDAWKLLESAFTSLGTSSSKILLTTRNKEVVRQVDDGHVYELKALSPDDAWTLLKERAFPRRQKKDVMVEPDMEALGRTMLKHCKGLPLAIVALGGILATKKTINEWTHVQERITSYLTSEVGEGSGVSLVLELSFHELPFYLKPCFMYLGNFPEDHEILAKSLYRLWEAEGIVNIGDSQNRGESRFEIAERYLNELVQRCMVQVEKRSANGKIKSCRVHDVMRDICLKKCEEVHFLSFMELSNSDDPSSDIAEYKKMHRWAIYPKEVSNVSAFFRQHQNNAPCLRSLFVWGVGGSYPYNFSCSLSSEVKNFLSLLRVLHIEGIAVLFQRVIGGLVHLRYLSLRDTVYPELPSCIFNLKHLETLDLRLTNSVKLPNKFWELEKLRHLYLPLVFEMKGKLIIVARGRQSSRMETLVNIRVEVDRWKIEEDLCKMKNLKIFKMHAWSYLEGISWDAFSKSPLVTTAGHLNKSLTLNIKAGILNEEPTALTSLKGHAHIRRLKISGALNVKFWHESHDQLVFPRNLTKLELWRCEISEEGILELGNLPHLKVLELLDQSVKGSKMSFPDGSFRELAELSLYLTGLEEWDVEKGALANLRYLRIEHCPHLKKIPEGIPSSVQTKWWK